MKKTTSHAKQNQIEINNKKPWSQLFADHIKFCCKVSSVHGLSQIVAKNITIYERILWILLVASYVIVGITQGLQIWEHFETRPVVINLERDYFNWQCSFPSLTICQKGFVRNAGTIFNKMMIAKGINMTYNASIEQYLQGIAFGDIGTYNKFESYTNGDKIDYLNSEDYLPVLNALVLTLENESPRKKSFRNTFPLSERRPIYPIITENGMCSVVNANLGIYYTPDYFNNSRPYNDFKEIWYKSTDIFVSFMTRDIYTNYEVFIHSADEMIDLADEKWSSGKETNHQIDVTPESVLGTKQLRKLRPAQRNCRYFNEADLLKHSPVYSYNLCRIECRIQLSLKFCNCVPYYYRKLPGQKTCNASEMFCLFQHKDEIITLINTETNKPSCGICLQTCNYVRFTVTHREVKTWFMDTYLQVSVPSFPVIRYKRNLIFSKIDLIVQAGGILALFLGSSLLSLIEVIYFISLRFYFAIFGGRTIKAD